MDNQGTDSAFPRIEPFCPFCYSSVHLLFAIHSFPVYQCSACCHQFSIPVDINAHVETVYSDEYFFNGKGGYENYPDEQDLLVEAGAFYADILGHHLAPGRLLDVGAAAGYLLEGFASAGWEGIGIEPNKTMAALGRQRGLTIEVMPVEQYSPEVSFDAITMIQVLPHFLDPQAVIRQCHTMLKAEGVLLIETWDRGSLVARLLGSRWHEYSPPTVLHWFSRSSLDHMMERCGFRKLAQGRPRKRIKIGHAASLLQYKMGQGLFMRVGRIPLSILPKNLQLPYIFDDIFWSLYTARDAV